MEIAKIQDFFFLWISIIAGGFLCATESLPDCKNLMTETFDDLSPALLDFLLM